MTETKEPRGPVLDVEHMSRKQLLNRIEIAKETQFGLDKATGAQLNLVYVLCRRWHLDPVTDLSLYRGRPWITIDGWARLIRRHPDWLGLRQTPLNKDEKAAWGYEPDDLVIRTVLLTKEHGEIEGFGKISFEERKNADPSTPHRKHPVEMAMKRSLARAARIAFGADVPDDTMIEQEMSAEIEAHSDVAQVRRNAAKYDQIYGHDDDWALPSAPAAPPSETEDSADVE
jgi:hypothetical protein